MDREGIEREIVGRTQVVDVLRAIPLGVLLPLETSVLLTIAIKHFDAAPMTKGVIAASGGVGLLVSPYVTSLTRHLGVPAMRMAMWVALVGAFGFLLAASGSLPLFVVGVLIGLTAVKRDDPVAHLHLPAQLPHGRPRQAGGARAGHARGRVGSAGRRDGCVAPRPARPLVGDPARRLGGDGDAHGPVLADADRAARGWELVDDPAPLRSRPHRPSACGARSPPGC